MSSARDVSLVAIGLVVLIGLFLIVLRYAGAWSFWRNMVLPWVEREAGRKPDEEER